MLRRWWTVGNQGDGPHRAVHSGAELGRPVHHDGDGVRSGLFHEHVEQEPLTIGGGCVRGNPIGIIETAHGSLEQDASASDLEGFPTFYGDRDNIVVGIEVEELLPVPRHRGAEPPSVETSQRPSKPGNG